jgi:site-specific DNA-adenine methylase
MLALTQKQKKIICIEKNKNVVSLLKLIKQTNFEDLNQRLIDIIEGFELSQSYVKGYNFYNADSSVGLGQFNKNAFLKLRNEFNNDKSRIDYLLVLVLYSFNNQIRFNSKGDFNLPVGKRDYNGSSRKNVASFNQISKEKKIIFKNSDFRVLETLNLKKMILFILIHRTYLGLLAIMSLVAGLLRTKLIFTHC